MGLRVHQAIARALSDNGVEKMFGLMGDANMYMVNSYIRDCGGSFIAARNEAGAVIWLWAMHRCRESPASAA